MAYRVEVGQKADAQLSELDPSVAAAVERKIIWLAQNAPDMIHRRLVGMPEDVAGLCKRRVGDWRILYWIYHADRSEIASENCYPQAKSTHQFHREPVWASLSSIK